MEHQTRFDLNAALENWRAELAAQAHLTPEDRRELETHLRDSFAGLQARGLSEEESFLLARHRVGRPQRLAEEFIKVNPAKVWRGRVLGMIISLIIFELWRSFSEGLIAILSASPHPDNRWGNNWGYLILRMLIFALPIVLVLTLMVNNRISRAFTRVPTFLNSSAGLGICLTLLVLIIDLFNSIAAWWNLRVTGPIGDTPQLIFDMYRLQLVESITPLTLIALLVWLFKVQQKGMKHA